MGRKYCLFLFPIFPEPGTVPGVLYVLDKHLMNVLSVWLSSGHSILVSRKKHHERESLKTKVSFYRKRVILLGALKMFGICLLNWNGAEIHYKLTLIKCPSTPMSMAGKMSSFSIYSRYPLPFRSHLYCHKVGGLMSGAHPRGKIAN